MALKQRMQFLAALLLSLVLYSCGPSKNAGGKETFASRPAGAADSNILNKPQTLFPLEDAVQILGEAAAMTDSSESNDPKRFRYQCAYHAISNDSSGKPVAVYFALEQYRDLEAARDKYTFIKKANQNHGIETLDDLGDEAYFHTDGTNFYFIMVRKANKVLSMKVNKITKHTSKTAFFSVVAGITEAL